MRAVTKLLLLIFTSGFASAASIAHECDNYCYLVAANQASLVMLVERDIVDKAIAQSIAAALQQASEEQSEAGARRSGNYLYLEQRLIELIGPQASLIHTGRSRQDLHGTVRRLLIRDQLLKTHAELQLARAALIDLAEKHYETVIPAYTHGVQAQPTSLAHYLLAFASHLQRDSERLEQAYARVSRSPLGAAALGTSGFALDRTRLSDLLGFVGVVENSYDANLVSSVDSKIEFANTLSIGAIIIGQFTQNLHTQYHDPAPWLQLGDGQTSISTIMPQKRNPRPIDRLRSRANKVIAGAQLVTLNAHNSNSGMHDYRDNAAIIETAQSAQAMYQAFVEIVSELRVDKARALHELETDYSTMTEVADVLLREANVPFRTAHHYASALTTFGRTQRLIPSQISDAQLLLIYEQEIGEPMPVPVQTIRDAMDPQQMVASRRGLGGPQRAETERMAVQHRRTLGMARTWREAQMSRIQTADEARQAAFKKLL